MGASVLRMGYGINVVREGSNVFTSLLGSNQGLNIDNGVDPATWPQYFGPAGSAWFRDGTLPSRPFPSTAAYPIPANFSQSINDFYTGLKLGYVQSWNIGWQRELDKDTVVEFRYTGNHGTNLWRQYNLNEVNIVENGFLNEFWVAQNNLRIARLSNPGSNNWGNQGLPGQGNLTLINAAYGNTTDVNVANNLFFGQPGALATSIATNLTRMNNLFKANPNLPANFFVVNPTVASGGAYIVDNGGSSFYGAGQMEVRRRMSKGVLLQGSYVWSKSLANGSTNSSSAYLDPTSLRDFRTDRLPSAFDIRHAVKINGVYDLPVGPGRYFLGNVTNPVLGKMVSGWQLVGNVRLQSGSPFFLNPPTSYGTFNNKADGVILHNMTMSDLQSMIGNYKATNANGVGIVTFLPDSVITNTKAAFNQGGLSQTSVDPNSKYIGPAAAGQVGMRAYFYLPWWRFYNFSAVKRTKIWESVDLEFRAQCLNCFNLTNFQPNNGIGSAFGQTTAAYRDSSGTVDPGGRILEFNFRLNF